MRKLILVALLATAWSSSCYANLSLASAAPVSTVAEPANSPAPEAPAPAAALPEGRPVTVAKSPSRPRRHFSSRAPFIRSFYRGCL